MLSAEAIVGSGTVPPSGGGNDKLNSASISFECGGPALDLLPCFTVSHVRRGPGGVKPESPDACSLIGHSAAKRRRQRQAEHCGVQLRVRFDLLADVISIPVGRGPGGATLESSLCFLLGAGLARQCQSRPR